MWLPVGWTDPERSLTDYISQVDDLVPQCAAEALRQLIWRMT